MSFSVDVRPLEKSEYEAWDNLVWDSPDGTVYHDTRWLNAVCEAVGDRLVVFGFLAENDLVAGVPLQIRRKGPFSLARRAFATPYSGIVRHPSPAGLPSASLATAVEQVAGVFSKTVLTFSPYASDFVLPHTWRQETRATFLLDITDPKKTWDRFAFEVRNRIRKARKCGVTVESPANSREFYSLYHDTFHSQGKFLPIESQGFEGLLQQLDASALSRSYLARMPDGRPAAACLCLFDAKRVYYSLAGSHRDLRKTGAPSFLVWRIVEDCSHQVPEFDFGGANIPPITQFKSKFRGRLVSYPEVCIYRNALLRTLFGLRSLSRKIRGT